MSIARRLAIIASILLLLVLAFVAGRDSAIPVRADTVQYSYLAVQAGDATPQGGKHVVDMRNGNVWVCFESRPCTKEGHLGFESIK